MKKRDDSGIGDGGDDGDGRQPNGEQRHGEATVAVERAS